MRRSDELFLLTHWAKPLSYISPLTTSGWVSSTGSYISTVTLLLPLNWYLTHFTQWRKTIWIIQVSISSNNQIGFENSVFSFKLQKCPLNSPAGIYLLKVNNRNTWPRCEISSNLTIKTPKKRHWRRSGVFIVTFEHISHLGLVPTKLPKVKIAAFSGLNTRKNKKNLDKNVTETNKKLNNYCRQKDIGYIHNSNITEDSLGIKNYI